MEPARKLDPPPPRPSVSVSPVPPPSRQHEYIVNESEREIEPWEIKLGKVIFYLTIAASLWFFYWLNGIQCPC
jgi:hypothetical protein